LLIDDLYGRSISSLSVYPDRAKGYLLVLALPSLRESKEANGETGVSLSSSILKLYDLGSYRLSIFHSPFRTMTHLILVLCTLFTVRPSQQLFVELDSLLMAGRSSSTSTHLLFLIICYRFVLCPCIDKTPDGRERFHVRAWDSQSGHIQESFLNGLPLHTSSSDSQFGSATIPYPFLPRSISWHPSQHMVAISMVGPGAAVGIYCANKAR
jgi:hypothetical protein